MISKKVLYIILSIFILSACSDIQEPVPVAQVGVRTLYLNELDQIVPDELSPADSALWADDFIKKWVKKELVILTAEQNLSSEQKNVEKELQEYRNSLITYRYKKELMAQKMDTTILDKEIEDYFLQHQREFILSKNIVKAVYLKTPMEVADSETIKRLSMDNNPEKLSELDEYGIRYAKAYDRFNDKWIDIEKILSQVPNEIPDQERFLRRNKFIESNDTDYYYFICIRDFRLKSETAPLEYVEVEIKNLLLNQRKIQFLKQIENDIFMEGKSSSKFKIFNVQK